MADGIDYSCTERAMSDIQAQNSHLFQFCQDNRLQYDPASKLTAGEIWLQLEQWYLDNGTLSYEETSTGKKKALWVDQARKGDANVRGANQIIARFQNLFPKTKRVTITTGPEKTGWHYSASDLKPLIIQVTQIVLITLPQALLAILIPSECP
jgi:putative DNA primase/helicase